MVSLRQHLVVSTLLTVPVVVLAMVPALRFDHWQWLSLTLARAGGGVGALPFHRAAWTNLRHGAATMDTLISDFPRCHRRLRVVALRPVPRGGG